MPEGAVKAAGIEINDQEVRMHLSGQVESDVRNMETPDTPFFNLHTPLTPDSAFVPFTTKQSPDNKSFSIGAKSAINELSGAQH